MASGEPKWLIILFFLAGIPFYLWGCVQLADARGYPRAIVFTAVFGLLFTLVLLLALPDKRRQFRRRINQP
jgi:hypothetical protein